MERLTKVEVILPTVPSVRMLIRLCSSRAREHRWQHLIGDPKNLWRLLTRILDEHSVVRTMSHSPTWLRTDKLALSTPFVSIFHTSVTWAMDIQYALYFPFDLRGASVFHSGWIPGQCQHRGLLSIRAPRLVYLLRRLKK